VADGDVAAKAQQAMNVTRDVVVIDVGAAGVAGLGEPQMAQTPPCCTSYSS
jgi:hypothetical protein